MRTLDTQTIQRRTLIGASRERVWRALTELGEFSQWFGVEAEGAFSTGARIRMVSTHPSCKGVAFYLTVAEMTAPRVFSWRWHPGQTQPAPDDSAAPTTLVEFRLEEVEGGTLVTVTESGFDQFSLERRAALYQENSAGWEYQLGQLERYAGASR